MDFQNEMKKIEKNWNKILKDIYKKINGGKMNQLSPKKIAYKLEEITKPNFETNSDNNIDFLILAAPTGGGKTTIGKELEKLGIVRFPRHVTRPPRPGEVNGKDYFFISMDEFKQKEKKGDFMQTSYTYGEGRGTDRKTFFDMIKNKKKFYIDGSARTPLDFIDNPEIKGINFVSICFLPPTFRELIKRLLKRVGQDKDMTKEYIVKRMQTALKQLSQAKNTIDVFYVNDNYMRVVKEIQKNIK